jgi:hypothetical protein
MVAVRKLGELGFNPYRMRAEIGCACVMMGGRAREAPG